MKHNNRQRQPIFQMGDNVQYQQELKTELGNKIQALCAGFIVAVKFYPLSATTHIEYYYTVQCGVEKSALVKESRLSIKEA